jgi:hypothetical protein
MRMQLKFRESAPDRSRKEVIETIEDRGKASVSPLFPGDSDPELASLYAVEGVPDASAKELMELVGEHDAVEFLEPGAQRKLID